MNRRDLLLDLAKGKPAEGYTPAAFFLHFGPDYQAGPAAIAKHEEFFRFTGMDFVKIQYERPFPAQSIQNPEDWASVRPLDLDFFQPMLEVVRGLVERLKAEAPVIVTLYSPLMCAGQVGGRETVTEHLRQEPDAVKPAMEAVTESLLRFVRACAEIGVDGFYHSTQGGEARRFADRRTFDNYVKPYDLQLMRVCERLCPFNILHVCDYLRDQFGGYDDLSPFVDYPGHIVNCSLELEGRTVTAREVSKLFGRPFMGGMDRRAALATGSEDEARAAARKAMEGAPAGFILGADCTVPNGTPWENLRAAIAVAHG